MRNRPEVGVRNVNPETQPNDENAAREIAALRAELAAVKAERDQYRSAVIALLDQIDPYVPPTEDELNDMLHGPRGQPLLEVIAEFEAELKGQQGATDGRG